MNDFADDELDDGKLLSLPPPKRLKVETSIDGLWPVTTVTYSAFASQAFFLVPFTCLWAGGSMYMLYVRQILERKFDLQATLFGIPFLLGSIFLIVNCLFLLFGKRQLTLSGGNGTYFAGIGPLGRTIRFKYDHNTQIDAGLPICLTNQYDANSLQICSGFSYDAIRYTAAILRRECRRV